MTEARSVAVEADRADRGATMAEYALIVGVIAIVVVVSADLFGLRVLTLFDAMSGAF